MKHRIKHKPKMRHLVTMGTWNFSKDGVRCHESASFIVKYFISFVLIHSLKILLINWDLS